MKLYKDNAVLVIIVHGITTQYELITRKTSKSVIPMCSLQRDFTVAQN